MLGVHQHRLPQLTRLGWHLGERRRRGLAAFERHHQSKSLAVARLLASLESESVGQALAISLVTPIADDRADDLVFPFLLSRGASACSASSTTRLSPPPITP